jgi:hypothetical protein
VSEGDVTKIQLWGSGSSYIQPIIFNTEADIVKMLKNLSEMS